MAQMCTVRVILENTVMIEKNEEINVPAHIDTDIFSINEIMFTPYKDKLSNIGVLAANSISFVSRGDKIPIRLFNTTDENLTIFKRTKLGCVEIPERLEIEQSRKVKKHIRTLETKTDFNHIQCIIDNIEADKMNEFNV